MCNARAGHQARGQDVDETEARQAGRLPQGWLGELKRRAVLRDLILLRHVLMTEMRDVHEKFVAMLFCATYIINVHKLGR